MTGDPETERKLRKQVKKYKALLQDAQEELEHERETRNNAAAVRGLRSQLEDLELREAAAVKSQKRLQSEMEELQAQYDELTRVKLEVSISTVLTSQCCSWTYNRSCDSHVIVTGGFLLK